MPHADTPFENFLRLIRYLSINMNQLSGYFLFDKLCIDVRERSNYQCFNWRQDLIQISRFI